MHSTPATIVHDLLADRGPMDSDALLKAARHDGAHLNADELDEMLHDDEQIPLVVCLPARRHGLGDQILTGRTFTHRITDTERALDVLVADPDLLVLGPLMEAGSEVLKRPDGDIEWGSDVDGERYESLIEAGVDPDDVIALPTGSLAGMRPGAVVGITLTRDGAELRMLEPGAVPGGLGDRIHALIDEYGDDEDGPAGYALAVLGLQGLWARAGADDPDGTPSMPVAVDDLMVALCAGDPDLLVLGPLMEAGSEVLKRPVGDMVRSVRGALADQRSVAGVASGSGRDREDAPEVRAMLEDFVRDYEKKWLDTSIPALGGKTPRQAVGDPTRRNDLIRLVDSFDDLADGPGSMRTDRLREALGL